MVVETLALFIGLFTVLAGITMLRWTGQQFGEAAAEMAAVFTIAAGLLGIVVGAVMMSLG